MTVKPQNEGGEGLLARVIKLVELADYQAGSVVSRAVIDKDAGSVTFFAFDKEQGLSEHTAPYDALVYILEGEAEITISDRVMLLTEGEMVIMPAGEPHALRAHQRFKMLLTMVRS
ncbi:MAG: cupin domain-containing protein [Dehalococcoidales bacterium]|jgi:quercetin dioxygenase-like cupin family protein|nr:cupin domain-containing protein [Dehalococcoidales bacterium]